MRNILLIILLLLCFKGYSQQNLYTFNNGILYPLKEIKLFVESMQKRIPPGYEMVPTIYHKDFVKDTTINYIRFSSSKKSSNVSTKDSEFTYKQDSTFLLLKKSLPVFQLTDMNGVKVSSSSLLGKPTLINFWAIWCGPCIKEMPELSRLKEKYKDQMNFISITENDSVLDSLKAFLQNKDFNYPVLDNGESYKKLLKIGSLPANLFIDRKGIVRYVQGNYPMSNEGVPLALESKDNFFNTIINKLLKETR